MSAVFIFEIKSAKKDKIYNFSKDGFFVMRMIFGGYDFWCVFETYVRILTSLTS